MAGKMLPANRLNGVNPSAMRKLFEIANEMKAQGKRVIDFGLGDIDIPLPSHVVDGITDSIKLGKTKYGPNQGEFALRDKIADIYTTEHQYDINADHVLVTGGSLESLFDIALAYVNPGEEVMIAEPEFAYFGWQVKLAGGIPISVSTTLDTEFTPPVELIQENLTSKSKALLINYPNNPTGAILKDNDFKAIVEICEDHNLLLISDEAYEKITFDGYKHKSAADFDYENTLIVNSASKSLCMTGLRVGYTVTNNLDLLKPVLQIHQYNTAHAGVPNQYGVLAGLEHKKEIINKTIDVLQRRRDAIVKCWSKIPGFNSMDPKATFYYYPNVKDTGMNATEFTDFALTQGVVVTPGNSFCFDDDNPGGNQHIRVSFGITNEVEIKEAAELLTDGLNNL